jgi:hypothetical protein
MTKKTFLGAMAVVTAVALTGSALVASNMGFKLNYPLKTAADAPTGPNADGTNLVALPDNRQTGMNTAKNLMDDIGSASVAAVQQYIRSSNAFVSYTGRKNGPANFNLNAGEAYYIKMLNHVDYIIVGADDPTAAYNLKNAADAPTGPNADGSNFYAYNYHQTAATAKALMDDIGSINVAAVSLYIKSSNAFLSYTGRKNSPASFNLTPGEGYIVKMLTTVNYLPSHY